MLTSRLHQSQHVTFAAYKVPHPLKRYDQCSLSARHSPSSSFFLFFSSYLLYSPKNISPMHPPFPAPFPSFRPITPPPPTKPSTLSPSLPFPSSHPTIHPHFQIYLTLNPTQLPHTANSPSASAPTEPSPPAPQSSKRAANSSTT